MSERQLLVGVTGMGKVQASIESVARMATKGQTILVYCKIEHFEAYKERLIKRRPDLKIEYGPLGAED